MKVSSRVMLELSEVRVRWPVRVSCDRLVTRVDVVVAI